MDFYYDGSWRMDWGLGNPNKTAALIACLMVATWAVAVIWKRGFWSALAICTALAWCLVQTYSRGGMVAFLVGVAVLLVWTPRPWPRTRWIGVMASLWVLGAFVLYAKAQTRYGQGLFTEDQSITNRLVIWKHVPEMMAAAPWGVGIGKAGDFYTQWFQPCTNSLNYLNLVNSHFNAMVEVGWLGSLIYIGAWLSILLLCWPLPQSRLKAIPSAIWIAFGVGACFSHVEESIWLWVLPVAALCFATYERFRLVQWPRASSFLACGAASVGVVAVLVVIGFATATLPITDSGSVITIGNGPTRTLIFVDRHVMGSLYGHAFRKFLATNHDALSGSSFSFIESSHDLPSSDVTSLVVSGRFVDSSGNISKVGPGKQVILVNPTGFPDDAKLSNDVIGKTIVYFGEYSETPSRSSWSNFPGVKSVQINGASDFVPSWPEAIWNSAKTCHL